MIDQEAETATSSQNTSFPWWVRLCRWLWKAFTFLCITVILSLLTGIGSTWLTSSKGEIPENSPLSSLAAHWSLVLLIGCCLAIVAIITRIVSRRSSPGILAEAPFQGDRRKMLQRLTFTYQTMREKLLIDADWLNLQLLDKPDAVSNPPRHFVRGSKQAERLLSAGTPIVTIFDKAGQELLILGEPGAGKTTLLVELAQQLVHRAEVDSTLPLPIYFLLTSWATKRQPLRHWLCEQITQFYHIRPSLARYWINQRQVLPLLDGLDEMEDGARGLCIASINAYHQEHISPLVVCSRTEKYTGKKRNQLLKLHHAVMVQPLSLELVDRTLANLGQPSDALRKAINKSSALQELARTPLMLNILVRTYAGLSVRQMNRRGAFLRQQVFDDYIQRMIQQKGNNTHYPLKSTQVWLHRLAQQMQAHNQTILFLEQLQPDWLPKRQRIFYRCCVGLFIALFIVLFEQLAWLLVFGLAPWLLKGLGANLLEGLLGALPLALTTGAFFGLFYGWRPIQPSEVLTWSWKDVWLRLLAGLVIGLTGGALLIISRRLAAKVSGKQLTERLYLTPNEGIRRSAKNGLLGGLFGGLAVGMFYALFTGFLIAPIFGLFEGVFYALFAGLFIGLLLGLAAFIQHYILRFWLWHAHIFPWRAVRFLDDASDRILLRRVNGGYSFAHRLLLDYFAGLDTKDYPPH